MPTLGAYALFNVLGSLVQSVWTMYNICKVSRSNLATKKKALFNYFYLFNNNVAFFSKYNYFLSFKNPSSIISIFKLFANISTCDFCENE